MDAQTGGTEPSLGGLIVFRDDIYLDLQRLFAGCERNAIDRRHIGVVAPDRQGDVVIPRQDGVRGVEGDPIQTLRRTIAGPTHGWRPRPADGTVRAAGWCADSH